MKVVFLDGERLGSAHELHEEFARALDFPKYYGKNLDALHDLLSERTDELGVIIVNADALAAVLGARWMPFLRLLAELKRERAGFHVLLEPFAERE